MLPELDGFAQPALGDRAGIGIVQADHPAGCRCVRPPILYGDVRRPNPMTVEWITYAQSLTQRPVKGMLTGPVTILAWSFVRDDQPLAECARADCATRRSAAGLRPRSEARIEDPRRACGVAQG